VTRPVEVVGGVGGAASMWPPMLPEGAMRGRAVCLYLIFFFKIKSLMALLFVESNKYNQKYRLRASLTGDIK
jgi:hypothetical protein